MLGVEAVASQSTLSRFFGVFTQPTCQALSRLHREAVYGPPSRRAGCTPDLDSWAQLHEDGHQEGVPVGYTRRGLKPCHRPLIAGLAEAARALCASVRPPSPLLASRRGKTGGRWGIRTHDLLGVNEVLYH